MTYYKRSPTLGSREQTPIVVIVSDGTILLVKCRATIINTSAQ